jgi:hypothetical protein
MSNFYHPTELAHFLKLMKTDCVGTLCANKKHVPVLVKTKKLKKGEEYG